MRGDDGAERTATGCSGNGVPGARGCCEVGGDLASGLSVCSDDLVPGVPKRRDDGGSNTAARARYERDPGLSHDRLPTVARARQNVVERILAERLVVLLRRVPDADRIVGELAAAGVGVVEITLDSRHSEDVIAACCERGDVSVLAGTVRTVDDVERARAAGAEACVCPTFRPDVIARSLELGLPVIPAALTPSEIDAAHQAGAALVKVFPAGSLGPGYLRQVLAPLADVRVLATGGIDAGNARTYLDAGAHAVAVGSAVTTAPDPGEAARALVAAVLVS
jgi:2-dehydro-3-deoxyphosphogluconate aldolase / (4S)-4-hydroxy-2-oxoglutarate aldolase